MSRLVSPSCGAGSLISTDLPSADSTTAPSPILAKSTYASTLPAPTKRVRSLSRKSGTYLPVVLHVDDDLEVALGGHVAAEVLDRLEQRRLAAVGLLLGERVAEVRQDAGRLHAEQHDHGQRGGAEQPEQTAGRATAAGAVATVVGPPGPAGSAWSSAPAGIRAADSGVAVGAP